MREDLKILAKHLAKKLDVRVEFIENAVPSTNGKKIILPTELSDKFLWSTLGSLIHEISHIRYTNFKHAYYTSIKELEEKRRHAILNALEDIRVDYRMLRAYPKANDLLQACYKSVTANSEKLEKLRLEPLPYQVIKHLIILSHGFEAYSDDTLEFIKRNKLKRYIKLSQKAKSTKALKAYTDELFRLLFGNDRPLTEGEEQIETEKGKKRKEKTEERKGGLNKKEKEIDDKISENSKEIEELSKKDDELDKKERELKDDISTKRHENSFEENEEKADEIEKLEEELSETEEEKDQNMSDMERKENERNEIYNEHSKNSREQDEVRRALNDLEAGDMGALDASQEILGFDTLKDVKLADDIVKLEKSIDETVREFFMKRELKRKIDEDGNRLAKNKLHRIVTTNTGMFTAQHDIDKRTRVAFLIDSSGSMQGLKAELALDALSSLLGALERVIYDESLNIETSIYTFNHRVKLAKAFDERYDERIVRSKYIPRSSTCILESILEVGETFDDGIDSEKVMIVLTDGEPNDKHELKRIHDTVPGDISMLYIGLDISDRNKNAVKLFGDYNIKLTADVAKVLTKALLEAVR